LSSDRKPSFGQTGTSYNNLRTPRVKIGERMTLSGKSTRKVIFSLGEDGYLGGGVPKLCLAA
jgi:hypothetical protein